MIKPFYLALIATLFLINYSNMAISAGQVLGGKTSTHPSWFKESFLELADDAEEAAEQNKHVMLFIHLNGCPYCYKMIEENIKNAPYTDFIKQNFDVIGINMLGDREVVMDEQTTLTEKQLATKLNVIYTPTIVFLNAENKIVARTDGYRSVSDFKQVLNYVQKKAYKDISLAQYLNRNKNKAYSFRDHPQIQKSDNLNLLTQKPLAIIFEDSGCFDCNALHNGHLKAPEVRDALKRFNFIRLDAMSERKLIDINGNSTTPKAYAEKLGLTYRPGIVLYDKGKEIARIKSMLYRYHFTEILKYVGEQHYKKYPKDFYDYLNVRTAELLESGQDVHISE